MGRPDRSGGSPCQSENLRDLLGRERAGVATPRRIAEDIFDGAAKGSVRFAAFDQDESPPRLGPAPPPHAHGGRIQVDGRSDRLILLARECPQNDLGPLHQAHGTRRSRGDLLQDIPLTFGNHDFGSRPWHDRPPCRERGEPG